MIFNRKDKPQVLIHDRGKISVSDKTIQKQLAMLALTEEELGILKAMHPLISSNINKMTESFYERVLMVPELKQIIETHSSVERLRKTLANHIVSMFNGVIDESYVVQRNKIASIHLTIGLQPKWYLASFQSMLDVMIEVVNQ
ncbi:MAG: protoglobin domain-containing protein, partial [Bacilli bacterium]